jgi:hypothetical protein
MSLPSPYVGLTWESLAVNGRVVMAEVFRAIEESAFCIFDVTHPNENVLFEIGFALGRAKSFWLTMDGTVRDSGRTWKELGLFSQIGYTQYRNSHDLIGSIRVQDPVKTPTL